MTTSWISVLTNAVWGGVWVLVWVLVPPPLETPPQHRDQWPLPGPPLRVTDSTSRGLSLRVDTHALVSLNGETTLS
ncbi:hypothetical protein EYF80_048752 [Liparis tanakae]|uniref:Uncharacterized protein n=1 Tax=Liparis tanakae TaxID=230148 RepID=A0A4Z2FIR8_9TELE|nr:hypothetical protein EYF80_048752 [Liparis tanakae]